MAYTVIKSTDPGAPTLNGTLGSLLAVMGYCLPMRGWQKVHEGTHKAVWRAPIGSRRFLRVVDDGSDATNGPRVARVRAYVDMSDIDAGNEPFPTDAQINGGKYIGKSTTLDSAARPWLMLVDGKRFVLMVAYHASHPQSYAQSFFGDPGGVSPADPYAAVLVAAKSTTDAVTVLVGSNVSGASLVHGTSGTSVSGYFPRARSGTGTSAPAYINRGGVVSGASSLTPGPDAAGAIWVDSLMVRDSSAIDTTAPRGYIPGVLYLMNFLEVTGYPSFTAFGDRFLLRCASGGTNAFLVDPAGGGDDV